MDPPPDPLIKNVILFDLDGTLLDDETATAAGLDALHAQYAHRIPYSRGRLTGVWLQLIESYFPRYLSGEMTMQEQRRARVRAIFAADVAMCNDEDADAAYAAFLDSYEAGWTCYSDVLPILGHLASTPLGVITNGNNEQQRKKLERTGLAKFFSVVVTSDEFGAAKPDPRIFAEACRRGGVDACKAVFIGDNWDADIEGSLAAGLRPFWIQRGPARARPPRPDFAVLATLYDLPRLLAIGD